MKQHSQVDQQLGIVLVDHGSRRTESNEKLLELAAQFQDAGNYGIVEPAHMELAPPTIAEAFDACVARGATRIVISPFFLLPGRHWQNDIPRLAAEAAGAHPDIDYLVASPLGLHPLMLQVLDARIQQCMAHAQGTQAACDFCAGSDACQWQS